MKLRLLFAFLIIILSLFFVKITVSSISANLPTKEKKAIFYSNQLRQDLKMTALYALRYAKSSIYLVMFGLTDPSIINLIQKKSNDNLDVKVYYDRRSSIHIDLKPNQAFSITGKGLMHQKILIVDKKLVFIGSANMTSSSLLMHDNMLVGLYSEDMAKFIIKKAPYQFGYFKTYVANQKVELFLLPDMQNIALKKLVDLMLSSKKSIDIAMFTLTHPRLVDVLIEMKRKGVNVKVAIDYGSSKGASKKAVERLKKEKIPILFNKGQQLRHHKFLLIDNTTLVTGSANWTKSAFSKNFDCFLILYNLDKDQKSFMKKLLKVIKLESFQK